MSSEQKTRSLPSDRTIYVSDVDFNIAEKQVEQIFAKFGKVESLQVKTIGQKKSLFVVFADPKAAQNALEQQGQLQIDGRPIRVNQYLEMSSLEPEANILISDLELGLNEQTLHQALSKYGKILSVKVSYDDRQKGIAYVQFESKDSASKCIEDSVNHKFKISKFSVSQKQTKNQSERSTLYVKDIDYQKSLESLKHDLKEYMSTFGEIDSIQVNHDINKSNKKPYAFVKFKTQQEAEKLLQTTKPFNGQQLVINWVIPVNDSAIESNLFTKNLKSTVTEEELLKELSLLVDVKSVQLLQIKRHQQKDTSQKALINLQTSDDGKKLMSVGLQTPSILALYDQSNVYLSPIMKQSDRLEFIKLKQNQYLYGKNQFNKMQMQNGFQGYQQFFPPQQMYQQFPQQYPQQNSHSNPSRGPRAPYQNRNVRNQPSSQQNQQAQYPNQYFPQQNTQQQSQSYPYNRQPQYQPQQPQYQPQQPQQTLQPKQLNLAELEVMKKNKQEEQIKQMVGQVLFNKVNEIVGKDKASQFTGILLDFENFELDEMVKMTQDATFLKEKIDQIIKEMDEDGDE